MTPIKLVCVPRATWTPEEFCEKTPPYSLALDGIIAGPPAYYPGEHRWNFDHHHGVDRASTLSTAEQIYRNIKLGLFQILSGHEVSVYFDDCDPDIILSVYLLRNHKNYEGNNGSLRMVRLVRMVGVLDATSGMYPLKPNSRMRQSSAWIFQDYTEARSAGLIDNLSAQGMIKIIDKCCAKIDLYLANKGEHIKLDTLYRILKTGTGWSMVREIGFYAREKIITRGINALVSVRRGKHGEWRYSFCKSASFVNLPIEKLFERLNAEEGILQGNMDRWNGANLTGGSPRKAGSKIGPAKLFRIIEEEIKKALYQN